MANALHSRQTTDDGIHIPYAFTYADAAARTSDTSRTSVDIGKFARQLDDNSIWMLVSIAPTWATVGSASGSYAPLSRSINAGSGLTGGGDLSADRTLSVVVDPSGSISIVSGALQVGILTADSQHGNLGGGSLHAVATTGSSGFLSFSDKIKLDGIASGSTNTPLTNTSPVDVTRSTSQVGVSTEAARSDHKHDISTSTPVAVGTGSIEGTSTSLARADHVHDHASVRQLIHFINDGPAEGYATGPYREALPAGSPFPTSITWWTSATKLHKIVEKTITRATNKFPTSISWMMYDSGDVVTVTVTDTYDYSSGILTPTVTRTIT